MGGLNPICLPVNSELKKTGEVLSRGLMVHLINQATQAPTLPTSYSSRWEG